MEVTERKETERERGPAGIRSTWRSADSLVRYDPNDLPLYGLLLAAVFPFSLELQILYVNGLSLEEDIISVQISSVVPNKDMNCSRHCDCGPG